VTEAVLQTGQKQQQGEQDWSDYVFLIGSSHSQGGMESVFQSYNVINVIDMTIFSFLQVK